MTFCAHCVTAYTHIYTYINTYNIYTSICVYIYIHVYMRMCAANEHVSAPHGRLVAQWQPVIRWLTHITVKRVQLYLHLFICCCFCCSHLINCFCVYLKFDCSMILVESKRKGKQSIQNIHIYIHILYTLYICMHTCMFTYSHKHEWSFKIFKFFCWDIFNLFR